MYKFATGKCPRYLRQSKSLATQQDEGIVCQRTSRQMAEPTGSSTSIGSSCFDADRGNISIFVYVAI